MNSRDNFLKALNHEQPERMVVDFGATTVTGIHTWVVEKLRDHYGLERRPVKVHEPFQFLGLIEEDLREALEVDATGVFPPGNMFGNPQENWKEFQTPWGQVVLVPGEFHSVREASGDVLAYPGGDQNVPSSARMPAAAFFFDAIIRQRPIAEERLDPSENLEEFSFLSENDLQHFSDAADKAAGEGRAVVMAIGGTHIGNIAMVPGMGLKDPKGIRDVAEWYMSMVARPDYLHEVFEKQTDIALKNLEAASRSVGDRVDVIYICGTDFGTQESSFCSPETFDELFAPYYAKMNNWIHEHTRWKTFKHCCGAIEPFLDSFIRCGFDIINPVQVSAAGMDPGYLKETYGDRLVFWGGGIDTQHVLPYGTVREVKEHVLKACEIFAPGGGFVFNAVHNIQANVPMENVLAMIEGIREYNGN